MSLHQLANHIQGAGRGQDKMLVHMTPGEVQGLQSLAMAHGGSLTINPQTGLPEAGILGKLLPTILGFALGPAGMGITIGGLSSAASAGLISGAVGTLATGSLGKGIMAGLGAYGGASLGGALKGMGGTAGPINAMAGADAGNLSNATYFGSQQAPSLANAVTPTSAATTPVQAMNQGILGSPMLNPAYPGVQGATGPSTYAVPKPDITVSSPSAPATAPVPNPVVSAEPPPRVEDAVKSASSSFGENMRAAGRGAAKVFESPESIWQFVKDNPATAAMVGSSLYSAMQEGPPAPPERAKLKRLRYEYDKYPVGVASSRSSERNYFPNARMVDTGEYYSANGGLMSLASGGPVEDMSRMNTIGANTGYPMADQMSSSYATAAQRPISENVLHPQGDSNVDPYTGEPRFAAGGLSFSTGGSTPSNPYGVPDVYGYGNQGTSTEEESPFADLDLSYNPATGGIGGGRPKTSTTTQSSGLIGQLDEKGALPVQQTRETLNPLYQKYFGRDIDPEGLATYTSRQFSPAELNTIFTGSEEYKAAAPIREAREREATYATPDQASDIYQRVMGRTPDIKGLTYYAKTNRMTPEEMEKSLRSSDEYFYNLAKPFVPPIHYGANNIASIEGAPYYDPTQYGFPSSQTNARNEIKGLYQNQLGRIADPRGEQYWADTIGADNQLSRKDIRKFSREAAKEIKERQAGYAAGGGISDLGAYSDGGRLLKGPGDGVSDSIPAVIGERQPARLADGEFVVPARIVSELGNGSTEAGARKLYAMMERIQSARKKSVGKGKVAANTKSEKYLPA